MPQAPTVVLGPSQHCPWGISARGRLQFCTAPQCGWARCRAESCSATQRLDPASPRHYLTRRMLDVIFILPLEKRAPVFHGSFSPRPVTAQPLGPWVPSCSATPRHSDARRSRSLSSRCSPKHDAKGTKRGHEATERQPRHTAAPSAFKLLRR